MARADQGYRIDMKIVVSSHAQAISHEHMDGRSIAIHRVRSAASFATNTAVASTILALALHNLLVGLAGCASARREGSRRVILLAIEPMHLG
jgi:hypothetical protein